MLPLADPRSPPLGHGPRHALPPHLAADQSPSPATIATGACPPSPNPIVSGSEIPLWLLPSAARTLPADSEQSAPEGYLHAAAESVLKCVDQEYSG